MTRPGETGGDAPAPRQAPETAPTALPSSAQPDQTPLALQREPLHFVVIILLIADIVFGLGLAVFAEKVLSFRPMAILGCGLAALGLGVLAYFVLLGGTDRSRRW